MSLIAQSRTAPAQSAVSMAIDPWIVIAFAFPILRAFVFDVGGELYGQDIAAVILLLLLMRQPDTVARLLQVKGILIMLGLWLVGQVATDIYRASAPEDYLRGWAKIVLFGIQFAALWLFLPRRPGYLVAFALGSVIAGLISVTQLEEPAAAFPWKFGLASAYGILVATVFSGYFAFTRPMRRYAPVALVLFGALVLFQGSRAHFGTFVLTGVFCALALLVGRLPAVRSKMTPMVFVLILAAGVVVGQGAVSTYEYLAESGRLGPEAARKFELQSGGDVSIIRGGRIESLVSTYAILDSPVLGHGSWARNEYYVRLLKARMRELGIPVMGDFAKTRSLIPTHSHLLGAWVEAGILGGLFWLFILYKLLVAAYRLLQRYDPLLPLTALCIFEMAWPILFSPFGSAARFDAAFRLVLALQILVLARGQGTRRPA